MIPSPQKTAVRVLLVLVSLWILQGCAHVSTQSRPADVERSPEIEDPSPVSPGVPAVAEPPASVAPEEAPPKAGAPVSAAPEAPADVEPVSADTRPSPYVHVVRWKGETLSLIAQWYTASWQNWKVIARANPGIDPDRIAIGNRIQFPESLLKRREPLPFDFVPPSPGRTRPKKTGGETTTVTGEIELFGPTETTGGDAPTPEGIELFEPAEIAGKPAEIPGETGLFGPME